MARFFHALVVAGAAISACGGRSERVADDDGAGPSGGSAGSSNDGESGKAGSPGTAGTSNMAGAGNATSTTGGSANAGAGGSGQAGTILIGGSNSSAGAGADLPEPGPSAQWNCEGHIGGCEDVLGTNATLLTSPCTLEPERPASAEDCGTDELFTCNLALREGTPLLVNCTCQTREEYICSSCTGIGTYRYGEPILCDTQHKVCGCAYTGILK